MPVSLPLPFFNHPFSSLVWTVDHFLFVWRDEGCYIFCNVFLFPTLVRTDQGRWKHLWDIVEYNCNRMVDDNVAGKLFISSTRMLHFVIV